MSEKGPKSLGVGVPSTDHNDTRDSDVARQSRQVYMSAAKRKVMACLDLRPEYACLLTTNDRATNIQAVPLWMCSQKVHHEAFACRCPHY